MPSESDLLLDVVQLLARRIAQVVDPLAQLAQALLGRLADLVHLPAQLLGVLPDDAPPAQRARYLTALASFRYTRPPSD